MTTWQFPRDLECVFLFMRACNALMKSVSATLVPIGTHAEYLIELSLCRTPPASRRGHSLLPARLGDGVNRREPLRVVSGRFGGQIHRSSATGRTTSRPAT